MRVMDICTKVNGKDYSVMPVYANTKTIAELSAEWLDECFVQLKESTYANYKMKLTTHVLPFFGDRTPDEVTPCVVSDFAQQKQNSGLSQRYITDIIVVLKCILRYSNTRYNTQNRLEGYTFTKRNAKLQRMLTEKQQYELMHYIKQDMSLCSTAVALSIFAGLRIGEICALKWGDIDFDSMVITIGKTIQRISANENDHTKKRTKIIMTDPKSTSSIRLIPISNCMYEFLKLRQTRNEYYVVSGTGEPVEPRTVQYRFSKLLDKLDLPKVNFHALRHMFATNCISHGFDVKTLSEILGHSSVEITLNRYVHSSFERKRKCMNMLDWK